MPVWGWILIAAIVVIAVLAIIVARSVSSRQRTDRLRGRFGPEYERTVGEVGNLDAAEDELAARERKREKLDIVPLTPEAQAKYADSWRTVQIEFVDNPSSAVGAADRLVIQVMRERGYPIDDFDTKSRLVSVDHPDVVENYRRGHSIYIKTVEGKASTEDLRQAVISYRALFEDLVREGAEPAS